MLTGVEEEVVLEVGLLAESSVADLTFEGPGAVVDVHVRSEVAGRGEGLRAETAFVRFFLRFHQQRQRRKTWKKEKEIFM